MFVSGKRLGHIDHESWCENCSTSSSRPIPFCLNSMEDVQEMVITKKI